MPIEGKTRMAGRIWIGPNKSLGVSTQAVPGGGYLNIDASAGNFGPSPLLQLGLQAAQGVDGIVGAVADQLAGDNEATVKLADTRVGEAEQALLFDKQNGYLILQGQDALTQAQAVLDAYTKAQDRERATLTDDDQRRMFAELADRRLATFSTQVERHAATERQRWYDQASERRIALVQADAELHWNDDALLRRSLGTARAEVRDQAERRGWYSAQIEAELHHQTSRTLVSAIGAAVDRDPARARSLRTLYAAALEDHHLVALDALLAEAETRERAEAATTEILNATPPDGSQPTPQWRLQQAEAIADPRVRAATSRRLLSATAAAETQARAVGEQVLTRVLKDGLTDPSQVPVGEWVALDAERRRAIEIRLDHNAASTEPTPSPALADALAMQMTQAPLDFARRDLVLLIAQLPLPQWQRFRDWQAGLRRNDLATEDQLYAIKRGLELATKISPAATTNTAATNERAELVKEIDAWSRINGRSPSDAEIASVLKRYRAPAVFIPNTREANPYHPVVETDVVPPWPPALEALFERTRGHHFIPTAVYKRLGVPEEALKVFRQATTDHLIPGTHQYDRAHREYSRVVGEVVDRYLKVNGIDPKNMTAAQARALVGHVIAQNHPVIRSYHEKMALSAAQRAARRAWGMDR